MQVFLSHHTLDFGYSCLYLYVNIYYFITINYNMIRRTNIKLILYFLHFIAKFDTKLAS